MSDEKKFLQSQNLFVGKPNGSITLIMGPRIVDVDYRHPQSQLPVGVLCSVGKLPN